MRENENRSSEEGMEKENKVEKVGLKKRRKEVEHEVKEDKA